MNPIGKAEGEAGSPSGGKWLVSLTQNFIPQRGGVCIEPWGGFCFSFYRSAQHELKL